MIEARSSMPDAPEYTAQVPQTEQTPFYPRRPYAAAKVYAYWATINYREAYGRFGSRIVPASRATC